MKPNPDRPKTHFRGWWIPVEFIQLWDDRILSLRELLLLAVIESLTKHRSDGCYASNRYFAERLQLKGEASVRRLLAHLIELRLIRRVRVNGIRFLRLRKTDADLPAPVGASPPLRPERGILPPKGGRKIIKENNTLAVGSATCEGVYGFGLLKEPSLEYWLHRQLTRKANQLGYIQQRPNKLKSMRAFAKLLTEVEEKQVLRVFKWYLRHAGEKYVPVAMCGASFRDKFNAIALARKRDKEKAAIGTNRLSPQEEKMLAAMKKWPWPAGLDVELPAVIQVSLRQAKLWREASDRFAEKNPRWRKFVAFTKGSVNAPPATLVHLWLSRVSERLERWPDYKGGLAKFTFSLDHRDFHRWGQQESHEYSCGFSLWDNSLAKIRASLS